MISFCLFSPLLFSLLISATEPPLPTATTVHKHAKTVLVLFGTRHGNRNPEKFVNVPNRTWGQEGELELTSIGKRQAYGLGKELRSFLGQFVNENFLPKEAKFYSSSANRCQMTLQSAIAGFYEPAGWADWNKGKLDNWSPVPYTINDQMLRMYAVEGCVASDRAWEPISKDKLPELESLVQQSHDLLQYMKEKDGRNATISNAADIADNIISMDFYNATYPDWLANPTLPGYNRTSLRNAYLSFAENHMNKCAKYSPCRNMMGGLWAGNIIESIETAAIGKKSSPKLIGYASHTEVTLAVMILMGYHKDELTTAAGFVIEMRNDTTPVLIRLLQHDPNPVDSHVIYRAHLVPELESKVDSEGWMDINVLKDYVSGVSFSMSNWESKCGIDKCSITSSLLTSHGTENSSPHIEYSIALLLPAFLYLLFSHFY